ncbi:MAG: hypothetical protein ACRDZ8_05920 [Acidimicrobiales bacterium]
MSSATNRGRSGASKGGSSKAAKGSRTGRSQKAMPAGAEAVRAERLAARQARQLPESTPDHHQGTGIIGSALLGTALFTVISLIAIAVPAARIVAVVVDLVLLVAGSGLYILGWGVAAGRSRDCEIRLWNLILLEDIAPNRVRAWLLGAVAVEIVVAGATCWIADALAFGWLVPVWGLAHCEYWGARYGAFLSRQPQDPPPSRRR